MDIDASTWRRISTALACALLLGACALTPMTPRAELEQQVRSHEQAFAQAMAERNFVAFQSYLAAEAIFFTGPVPLRGRTDVAAGWKRFFERPAAPFSWTPGEVEVLDSGTLAISSGPVRDPGGKIIATFTSIWRQESPGVWRVIFDKGNDVCDCAKGPAQP